MKKALIIISTIIIMGCNSNIDNMSVSGNVDGLMKGTLFLQSQKDSVVVNLDSMYLKGDGNFKLSTYINDPDILLLSHSVTPNIDSVPTLKKYAIEKKVIDNKWHLVTGSKNKIYKLARESYLAVKSRGDNKEHGMIHTENFVLIDKQRRIRGFYDGTNIDSVNDLINDILILKQEQLKI